MYNHNILITGLVSEPRPGSSYSCWCSGQPALTHEINTQQNRIKLWSIKEVYMSWLYSDNTYQAAS